MPRKTPTPPSSGAQTGGYLLIASDLAPLDGPKLSARQVFDLMYQHSCWEFPLQSGQARLQPGDRLFFYLGGKTRRIVGEATVVDRAVPIEKNSPTTFDRNFFPYFVWRLPLKDFRLYESDAANLDFLMQLSFALGSTVTRPFIGLLLRVGMRGLTVEDVALIRQTAGVV